MAIATTQFTFDIVVRFYPYPEIKPKYEGEFMVLYSGHQNGNKAISAIYDGEKWKWDDALVISWTYPITKQAITVRGEVVEDA